MKISNQKIGKVFFSTPRDGYKKGSIWIPRTVEETAMMESIENTGVSICLDGPTGTGKSSLAITSLKKRNIKFIQIQITTQTTWKNFCLKLLNAKTIGDSGFEFTLDAGIDKGLPVFKISFGITENSNSKEQLEYEDLLASRMTEDDICRILLEKQISLLIDDFEKANKEIVTRVSDMCKLLTQSYVSPFSKLIIVGTEDVYRRILNSDISLQERLIEISIGTLTDRNQAWLFLEKGLDKLGLTHPTIDYRNGHIKLQDLKACKKAFFDAADGLLKSINSLGAQIARNSTIKRRISIKTVLRVSKKFLLENVKKHAMDYPALVERVTNNNYCRLILIHLYKSGIGQIHHWEEVALSFKDAYDEKQIENALSELVEIGFLIRTGFDGEILFLRNPILGHTIGTIISNPNYGIPKALQVKNDKQMKIPFLNRENTNTQLW